MLREPRYESIYAKHIHSTTAGALLPRGTPGICPVSAAAMPGWHLRLAVHLCCGLGCRDKSCLPASVAVTCLAASVAVRYSRLSALVAESRCLFGLLFKVITLSEAGRRSAMQLFCLHLWVPRWGMLFTPGRGEWRLGAILCEWLRALNARLLALA